jgi:hypothetical protein
LAEESDQMQTPKVTEITALSAHRRDAALVRTSPASAARRGQSAPGADRLRSLHPSVPPQDRFVRNW